MIPEQHRRKAAWVTICTTLLCGAEGVRQNAYRDVGGVPTICFGETQGVKIGDRKTIDECKAMLDGRLQDYADGVDNCTTVELPPERKAAMVDFAYNEGVHSYCRYIAPALNAGRTEWACDHLLVFTKAAGVVFPGLVKRRQAERKLCMEGLV